MSGTEKSIFSLNNKNMNLINKLKTFSLDEIFKLLPSWVVVKTKNENKNDIDVEKNENDDKNILFFATHKENKNIEKLIKLIKKEFLHIIYINNEEEFEKFIMSQKMIIEKKYDITDTLLIIDGLLSDTEEYSYVIDNYKKIHVTTVTLIKNLNDIRLKNVNKMDMILLFKEKSKINEINREKILENSVFGKGKPRYNSVIKVTNDVIKNLSIA